MSTRPPALRVSHVWRDEVMGDRVLPPPILGAPTAAHYAGAVLAIIAGVGILGYGLFAAPTLASQSRVLRLIWDFLPLVGVGGVLFGGYYYSVIARARRNASAGRAVTIGTGPGATFTTPSCGLPANFEIFRWGSRGYVLTLGSGMSGTVRVGGEELHVEDFLARGGGNPEGSAGAFKATPVGPGDWGVIYIDGLGEHTIFFQFVPQDDSLPIAPMRDPSGLLLPSLAFSLVLHGTALGIFFTYGGDGGHSLVFPGTEALMNEYLIERPPAVTEFDVEEPKAGAEDGEPDAPPASTVGESGKSGGEGDEPRKRAPDPDIGTAEDAVVEKVRNTGLLRHGKTFDKVAQRGGFDKRLGNAMARIQGPLNDGGAGGYGRGKGTGVGDDGEGTGTTRGGTGKGPGGGGTAHGDVVTQGVIETGGKRAPRGTPGGRGVKEVAVSVKTGNASGDFGGLTREQVSKVVTSRQNAFKACYERELQRSPNLSGKIEVRWEIDPQGGVNRAKVSSTTMRNGGVEDCIVRQVSRLRFPKAKNGQPTIVKFPFFFQS